jgi:hypothetical protein
VEDGRLSAGCLLAWVLPLSFLLLGIASLLAGVYRKVVGWAFIVMGAATLVALPFNEPVVEVTIGVARVVVSAFARRVPELAIESPTPHPYSPRRSGHEHATDAGSSTTTATSPVPGFRYRRRQGP